MPSDKKLSALTTATAFETVEQKTRTPILIITLAMIPALIVPKLVELQPPAQTFLNVAVWSIWAIIATDYLVKLRLSINKRLYFKTNIPELLIVALPPVRAIEAVGVAATPTLLRLLRISAFLSTGMKNMRRFFRHHKLHYIMLMTLTVTFVSAALVVDFEKAAGPGAHNIKTMGDGLWWALTTITTIGYGDIYPTTAAGRAVAAFLMVTGIVFFSLLTANIAAFLVSEDRERPPEMREIIERLERIENRLNEP